MRVPPTEAEESLCFSEDVEGEAVCPRQVRKKGRGSKTQMPQSVGSGLVWSQGCLPGSVIEAEPPEAFLCGGKELRKGHRNPIGLPYP